MQALKSSVVNPGSSWGQPESTWGQPGVKLGSSWGQPGVILGSSWGQAGVKLGSSWGQAGVKLGSSWGQAGVNRGSTWGQPWGQPGVLGSTRGQPWVNLHRPTSAESPFAVPYPSSPSTRVVPVSPLKPRLQYDYPLTPRNATSRPIRDAGI